MQEGAAGWERERERKEPVCSPPVHILEPLTDEASPYDWRRVVGLRATSEAPLPCRLGPLLDDYPETRLMGPVGAPEIPTRTGHNARLKVGSTTDGKAPMDATTFKQGRTVTSPDLLPVLPFSLLFLCPSIASLLPCLVLPLCVVHLSSSSADSSASLTTLSSTFLYLLLSSSLSLPMTVSCTDLRTPCASIACDDTPQI